VAERRRDAQSGSRRFGTAYQGAFEAVFSIVIGAGLGYAADRRFGSEPWGVVVGLVLGFGAFVLRLVRLGREVQAEAPPGPGGPSGSRGDE
jgi:ATP synthase protein I